MTDNTRSNVLSIHGGCPVRGSLAAAGSKNAALPIMAASILADEPVELAGTPDVTDVNTLALMLGHLGVEAKRHADGTLHLHTVDPAPVTADAELVDRMRASFCVLGPLLARRGRAVVALPGGCSLGARPVDLHLQGLAAMGAKIRYDHNYIIAEAKFLHGAEMNLAGLYGPTVTGTANILMAATLARGETIIHGAAREPEIIDLGKFLIGLGARIDGLGASTLHIQGVKQLGGTGAAGYRVIPDRIETGTLLLAGAITGGDVTVRGCRPDHLEAMLAVLDDAGVMVDVGRNWIRAAISDRPQPFHFSALPYPGVPTDLQAPLTALAAIADGSSTICDCVFPQRFGHVDELNRLGASIQQTGNAVTAAGVEQFSGAEVFASDLRAGAALVLAGLAAPGRTVIHHAHHLARGYEALPKKLQSLGAEIEAVADAWYTSDGLTSAAHEPSSASNEFSRTTEYDSHCRSGVARSGADSQYVARRAG
ncbi:MAG TPA: UDP-N-acetylglucosamine 1-carboxyvinyltransferase [Pirellulales bacterium]|jgi:UDP-N-acetylglucosamine 1-carboxyvinyltransferase|nr:UDP-N-acetylglucosamine 1-carboxyvinyltransferase [Pirellulales bacterium]